MYTPAIDNAETSEVGAGEAAGAFAAGSLEALRRRLLDLTGRNRLLNFTHGRQGNVRLIDELPDELHRTLLSEEELRFEAVPDPSRDDLLGAGYIQVDPQTGQDVRVRKGPSALEWGDLLGLDTSYELPSAAGEGDQARKHLDRAIQTPMFPAEMETRLRGLRNAAETAIEETGANICYAAFGFLEWFDAPDSDRARLAPLLLVPVRIAKGRLNSLNGTYNYTIAYTGEDILPNLSLREKLRIDFGLALPDLDESTAPEAYFALIRELIARPQPRWRVRRFATVALLNFSKLLMYLDLDPERWPQESPLTAHPIVSRFFSTAQTGQAGGIAREEHPIDDLPQVHERYPIIDDADSSQHSALVDAIEGRNLVIEGPPGTGKSQTITNLIAAALAQGKRVLFVAEKLAALEVVKRRLDQAGLGAFCLELHSHKTQKRKVLEDIALRLANQDDYRQPAQIDLDIARYEALKDELRGYVELINGHWRRTGLSVHQILMAATRYREQLGVDPSALHPDGYDGDMFTPAVQRESLDGVRLFADVHGRIAAQLDSEDGLQGHPWHGVGNRDLQLFDKDRVCAALSIWQDALTDLATQTAQATALLAPDDTEVLADLDAVAALVQDLAAIPPLNGDEVLCALPYLQDDNLSGLARALGLVQEIRGHGEALAQHLRPAFLDDATAWARLRTATAELQALGGDADAGLSTLAGWLKRIARIEERLAELGKAMADVALGLGPACSGAIRLDENGLSELRALVELVGQLRPALVKLRGEHFDDDTLDDLLPELDQRLQTLTAQRQSLSQHFALDRLPLPEVLDEMRLRLAKRGLLRWLDGGWRAARRQLIGLSPVSGARFRDLAGRLEELAAYARDKRALEQDARLRGALGAHFTGLDTPVADLVALRTWYRAVRKRYGIGFGPMVPLGDALLGMPASVARGIQSLGERGIGAELEEVVRELSDLRSAFRRYPPLQRSDAPLVAADGPLSRLGQTLSRNLSIAQPMLTDPDARLVDLAAVLARLAALEAALEAWRGQLLDPKRLGGHIDLPPDPRSLDDATLASLRRTEALARVIAEDLRTPALREAIRREPGAEQFAALTGLRDTLSAAWQAQLEGGAGFAALTELDRDAWGAGTGGTLGGLSARNGAALERPDWLSNWLDYVRVRHQSRAAGFGALAAAVEQGVIRGEDIEAGYRLAVHDLLARQILKEIPGLARFSGNAQLALQTQFRDYDERLKRLQRERIAWCIARNLVPPGTSGGKVSSYTELALLRHECTKKTRHIPLRQLVRRAGNALAALKPCFMMGPMSVAQYLAPGQIAFDLVVMDEASQMKPEDSLGAIGRGGQLVVVGDPKQLPPTSFFDRALDGEDEDATAIQESESILETALPLFEWRQLRWHYRSRHEHLIAFSNQAFYDGSLVVFPAPHAESDELGVKLTRVAHGRFVNRRNLEEARVIALAVQHHLLHRPAESIGVVAMSAEQRDQIERAVEALSKEDALFQQALEQNLQLIEPLFIKNLENVQGDERDVIYISCTYGPEEVGGTVYQRFGPINSAAGWRRLNVLFTRSKKRMHVFSSMRSEDILVSEKSSRGVAALRGFLAFAETGHLHQSAATGRAPDSDFEVAVAAALGRAGFECVPQVGVAGFFIDLAVRDPGSPGRYLMGIECDGASYHSAKSVRDRDRLRQAVLERLGWRIRRIWSTDWYRNPQAEIGPILRELETLKTQIPSTAPDLSASTETTEIAALFEREEQREGVADTAVPAELDLRGKLQYIDTAIIRRELVDTPANQRLLRPAMLEALLEFLPVTKSEFVERIPLYLRQATSPTEGNYLDRVLKLIAEAEATVA